eukprot:TRINITY_DN776302_c0_g1_i1.p1 TRINITY_DN776302_c0_g1~~TRINITY_DN776302_c0_g1_i1.p1  ORF type:complete len:105 (-),score=18.55 TRINITY_DN776302_c0_g1_i1:121-435(-)
MDFRDNVPRNIQRRVQEDTIYAQRNQHVRARASVEQNAKWTEKETKKSSEKSVFRANQGLSERELKELNTELVRFRQQRLKALYTRELEEWQQEFEERGLSIIF